MWLSNEEVEELIQKGVTCDSCTFVNDCKDDEICNDYDNPEIVCR